MRRGDFTPYPTNRVVGTIADPGAARDVVDTLLHAGFSPHEIAVLHGDADLSRLDPERAGHGVVTQIHNALIRVGAAVEDGEHLGHHLADVRAGRFVIMVHARTRRKRDVAAEILDAHGADYLGFYGRWMYHGLPHADPAEPSRHSKWDAWRIREAALDRTIEDSFPASDPPCGTVVA